MEDCERGRRPPKMHSSQGHRTGYHGAASNLDNRANQLNPNYIEADHPSGYHGAVSNLNNRANQLNPNNPLYRGGKQVVKQEKTMQLQIVDSLAVLKLVVDSLPELDLMQVEQETAETLTGGALVGGMTTIGGLLMGPRGVALGGILGGLAAAAAAYYGMSKSIATVIKEDLSKSQQTSLLVIISHVANVYGHITDEKDLLALLKSNKMAKMATLLEIESFITNEVGMKLAS